MIAMGKEALAKAPGADRQYFSPGVSRGFPNGISYWLWQNAHPNGNWLDIEFEVSEKFWKECTKNIFFKGMSRSDIKESAAGGKVTVSF